MIFRYIRILISTYNHAKKIREDSKEDDVRECSKVFSTKETVFLKRICKADIDYAEAIEDWLFCQIWRRWCFSKIQFIKFHLTSTPVNYKNLFQ